MTRIAIHVEGNLDSPAMRPVREFLESLRPDRATIEYGDSPPTADSSAFPDLVVVCQLWPDEYGASRLHALLTACPLARLVCCYGPWCESDGRNRDIWPAAARVPVSFAPARIARELEVIDGKRAPLPLTASRDEIFRFDAEDDLACRFGPV